MKTLVEIEKFVLKNRLLIQLPDNCNIIGYKRHHSNRFNFEAVYSPNNLTELEMLQNGQAYAYQKTSDKFKIISYTFK